MKPENEISEQEMAQVHKRISHIIHRSDCQHQGDTDECLGCRLAECYDVIRALMVELRSNPQRDSDDMACAIKVIDRAKEILPEFRGIKFGNTYLSNVSKKQRSDQND